MISRRNLVWISLPCLAAFALWITNESHQHADITDFAAYWTASQRLLGRENPYATAPVLAIERRLGFRQPLPLVMCNPPWAFPFVLPLGLLPYTMAQRLWLWIGITAILISIQLLWRFYTSHRQSFAIDWVTAGLFLPVSVVLAIGQIGPLILLGITGFLVCEKRGWDLAAGASAMIITVKPHLVFLFWPALFLWLLQERRWRVLGGFVVTLGIASVIPLMFDSKVFAQYYALWKESPVIWSEFPSVGGALCRLMGRGTNWLAFVPVCVAAVSFMFHWLGRRRNWHWGQQMPWLLLVSVASTPYGWFFDHVVLLPAVMQQTTRVSAMPRQVWFLPAVTYLAINAAVLVLLLGHRTTFWYAWTAPAWLLLYSWLRAKGVSGAKQRQQEAGSPD